jgi:hypothetical protein
MGIEVIAYDFFTEQPIKGELSSRPIPYEGRQIILTDTYRIQAQESTSTTISSTIGLIATVSRSALGSLRH